MARDIPRIKHFKVQQEKRLTYLRSNLNTGRRNLLYDARSRRAKFDSYRIAFLPDIKEKECYVCGKEPQEWHHIVQLVMGGSDHWLNLVPLCRSCHKRVHRHKPVRSNRDTPEYVCPFSKPKQEIVIVQPEYLLK